MKIGKCVECAKEGGGKKINGSYYCSRHYQQMRRYGKIKSRTTLTKNEIRNKGIVCEMDLYDRNGRVIYTVIFDSKFLSKVKKFKWTKTSFGYAKYGRGNILLHRMISNAKDGQIVDHINRNTADNRKENLRIVDNTQNAINKRTQSNNTSGYSGINYDKHNKKWKVRINYYKKSYWLGRFKRIEDAMEARNNKAKELFKEFNPHRP